MAAPPEVLDALARLVREREKGEAQQSRMERLRAKLGR